MIVVKQDDGKHDSNNNLPIIISKLSRKGSTTYNHIMFNPNPHIKSYAALILLNNKLMSQDESFINDDFRKWLEFREVYLNKQLSIHKTLNCSYCNKPNLEIGGKTPKDLLDNNKNPNLATIDHIIPLCKGGDKYDEQNICVCCKNCNKEKGIMPAEKFIQKIKNKNSSKI